jgi:hypothetical protein
MSVSNTQAVVSTVDGIAVAICVVNLIDDLGASFGPEAEAFDGDAVDEEEIVTNEAYRWTFGTVGETAGEVPVDQQVSVSQLMKSKGDGHGRT